MSLDNEQCHMEKKLKISTEKSLVLIPDSILMIPNKT